MKWTVPIILSIMKEDFPTEREQKKLKKALRASINALFRSDLDSRDFSMLGIPTLEYFYRIIIATNKKTALHNAQLREDEDKIVPTILFVSDAFKIAIVLAFKMYRDDNFYNEDFAELWNEDVRKIHAIEKNLSHC